MVEFLLSIKLAELPNLTQDLEPINLGPFPVTFFGERVNGTIITNTFIVDEFLTLKEFSFTGFGGLVAVHWYQGAGGPTSPTHQFDDVRVVPVSEPNTMLLLTIGFSLLLYFRKYAPISRGN